MQLFLDTANLNDIAQRIELGLVDGVTTNPSLIAREGVEQKKRILEISKVVDGPISAEVTTEDLQEMITQGMQYHKWHKNVYVKLPCTETGLKALKALKKKKVKVNMTLVFSVSQAVCCAKLGADFISPFMGRLDDIGDSGIELIADIKQTFDNYGFETKVLAASIRSFDHVTKCMQVGCDIATIPVKIFDKLLPHPLTQKGQEKFLEDFRKSQQ
jgi:transaldolase